jgi:site-specific DNA recombinase
VALGHTAVMRWNDQAKWVTSRRIAHEPLIDDATFAQAQSLLTRRGDRRGGEHQIRRTRQPYVFRGLIYCAICDRRMQGQYSHGSAYYRCRFPQEYALANRVEHPRNVIMREDVLVDPLDAWLATALAPAQRDQTVAAMAAEADTDQIDPTASHAQHVITECDAKLERYRQALDAGADPAVVATWIEQTQTDRAKGQTVLGAATSQANRPRRMSREQINELVRTLGDIVATLSEADPADKAEVYRQLGLRLTYHPETQTVHAEANLNAHRWGIERVRGPTRGIFTW